MKHLKIKLFLLPVWLGSILLFCACKKTDTPVEKTSIKFAFVTGGWNHTLAISKDGYLYVWGDNYSGQLGLGTAGGFRNRPEMVGSDVISIGAGDAQSFLIKSDGSLWACGWNEDGQLGIGAFGDKSVFTEVEIGK